MQTCKTVIMAMSSKDFNVNEKDFVDFFLSADVAFRVFRAAFFTLFILGLFFFSNEFG